MCGRFYVDEGIAKEIERVIRGVDLRIQKMRTGDIYPSQPAGILTCHSRQKEPLAPDLVTQNAPAFELKEMHWGFTQYQKKGLLINARAETALVHRIISNQPYNLPDFPSASLLSIGVAPTTPHSSALHMKNHSALYG